jgi:hypothetical protein
MANEKWLALDNEDHDKFAAAMMLCQNGSGWCVHAGRCFYDGDCFRTDVSAYTDAARRIRKLAEDERGLLRSALLEAASHMDTMKQVARDSRS